MILFLCRAEGRMGSANVAFSSQFLLFSLLFLFFFFFVFAKKLVIVNPPNPICRNIGSAADCTFALNCIPARRTQTSFDVASDFYRTDFLAPLRLMTKELFLVPL